jgi:hypothetical protein
MTDTHDWSKWMLTLKIDTDNAAFRDSPDELARLLSELAGLFRNGLPEGQCYGRLRDVYGNTCGRWSYDPSLVTD